MKSGDKLLTPKEAAVFLSVSMETLAMWRSQHRGPDFVKLESRLVRYWLSALESWLRAGLTP